MTVKVDSGEWLSFKALSDEGYLHEANRLFFHPHGLALTVYIDEHGHSSLRIQDYRDDPEGIIFTEVNEDKAKAVHALWYTRLLPRHAALGYMVQPVPSEEPPISPSLLLKEVP